MKNTALSDAIDDLKGRIKASNVARVDKIIKQVATDWDIRLELLERHFKSTTGLAPDKYPNVEKLKIGALARQMKALPALKSADPFLLQAAINRAYFEHNKAHKRPPLESVDLKKNPSFAALVRSPIEQAHRQIEYIYVNHYEIWSPALITIREIEVSVIRIRDALPMTILFPLHDNGHRLTSLIQLYGTRKVPGNLDWLVKLDRASFIR